MGNQTSGGAGAGGGSSFLAKDTKDKRKAMRSALDDDLIPKNAYERILDSLPSERIKSAWLGGDVTPIEPARPERIGRCAVDSLSVDLEPRPNLE